MADGAGERGAGAVEVDDLFAAEVFAEEDGGGEFDITREVVRVGARPREDDPILGGGRSEPVLLGGPIRRMG